MYRIQTGFDIMQDMVDFFSSMKCSKQHFRVAQAGRRETNKDSTQYISNFYFI